MNGRQNGMALVVVLWLVVLLSIMAAGHTRGTHIDTQLASRQLAVAQARGYAEAGINHTALMLLSARGQEVPVDGSIFGEGDGDDFQSQTRKNEHLAEGVCGSCGVQPRVKIGHAQDSERTTEGEEAAENHQYVGHMFHHWKNLLDSTNRNRATVPRKLTSA